jgi:hypothetical protein
MTPITPAGKELMAQRAMTTTPELAEILQMLPVILPPCPRSFAIYRYNRMKKKSPWEQEEELAKLCRKNDMW